jgi:hypothetical protein
MPIEVAALICVAVVLIAAFLVFRDRGRFSLSAPFIKLSGRFARGRGRSSTSLRRLRAGKTLRITEETDAVLSVHDAEATDMDIRRRRPRAPE